ncbi:MAG: type II secretion system F family protein, partial [Bacilli bacterium]|nr:type II secretion system F family protein [Bacilli bacterium]
VVKDIIIYNELTIFTKTFASLLKNNVFITESMDILIKITNNEIYKDIMFNTIDNISRGESISESFKNHWAIPDVAYHMIVTGESTGELAEMMQKVSEYYQEQHRNIVTNLKNFIEPVLICSLALIVGVIIIAVLGPMFSLYDTIE